MKILVRKLKKNSGEKQIGITADGTVVIDRNNSHVHGEGGMSLEVLSDAVSRIDLRGKPEFVKCIVQFDRNIGFSHCVAVTPNDDIVMVHRIGRGNGLTPMVINREPEPCDKITIMLLKRGRKAVLITAFIGGESEKEPWDPHIKNDKEKRRCIAFWKTHALIYDVQQIDYIA